MTIDKVTNDHLKFFLEYIGAMMPGLKITVIVSEPGGVINNFKIGTTTEQNEFKEMIDHIAGKRHLAKSDVVTQNGTAEFDLECRVKVNFSNSAGDETSAMNGVRVLCPFPGYVRPVLKDGSGQLTYDGLRTATTILTHGLASNIHYGHELKRWDSAVHLRYAIELLEQLFITVADISINQTWEDK